MVGQAAILGREGQEEGSKEDQAGGTAGLKALRQATAWLLGELEGSGLKCAVGQGSPGGEIAERGGLLLQA